VRSNVSEKRVRAHSSRYLQLQSRGRLCHVYLGTMASTRHYAALLLEPCN
jgi:hypothetical protein